MTTTITKGVTRTYHNEAEILGVTYDEESGITTLLLDFHGPDFVSIYDLDCSQFGKNLHAKGGSSPNGPAWIMVWGHVTLRAGDSLPMNTQEG